MLDLKAFCDSIGLQTDGECRQAIIFRKEARVAEKYRPELDSGSQNLISMASVVKWLRPRIVVPICVGSNPTTRPIKKTVTFVTVFFIESMVRTRSH